MRPVDEARAPSWKRWRGEEPQRDPVEIDLRRRFGQFGVGIYGLLGCVIVLAVAGIAAVAFSEPLLFPSLGPTAMLFFENPLSAESSPRNCLVGHLVGLVVGFGCLAVFGLRHAPAATSSGVTPGRVAAAALSVGVTSLVLRGLRCSHAPAGATTLIVSLGILKTPTQLVIIAVAVVVVTVAAWLLNRALGLRVPAWGPS